MRSTLKKLNAILEPTEVWELAEQDTTYACFKPREQKDLIAIVGRYLKDLLDAPLNAQATESDEAIYIHAYRALASFKDPGHLPHFLDWLERTSENEIDGYCEDLMVILLSYGSLGVAKLVERLQTPSGDDQIRLILCEALQALAEKGIQRDIIIQAFTDFLEKKHFARTLNAAIICSLLDLDKGKHLELIRSCYRDHRVNISYAGDLEDIEIAAGQRLTRSNPQVNLIELEKEEAFLARKLQYGPRPSEDEPEELFCYLLLIHQSKNTLTSLSAVDGFLTGVLINKTMQNPSDFIPRIWDAGKAYQPSWESKQDAALFLRTLLCIYNVTAESLIDGVLDPFIDEFDEGGSFLETHLFWLTGFIRGYEGRPPEGQIIAEKGKVYTCFIKVIEAMIADEEGDSSAEPQRHFEELIHSIQQAYKENQPHATSAGTGFSPFSDPIPFTRSEKKTSRNASCPCGSGKKYKRCCLN